MKSSMLGVSHVEDPSRRDLEGLSIDLAMDSILRVLEESLIASALCLRREYQDDVFTAIKMEEALIAAENSFHNFVPNN